MKKKLFIIIGAMKSGTTTLHDNLCEHPDIEMTNFKEPNFFNKYYSKGEGWYLKKFNNDKTTSYFGDATPAYSWRHVYPSTAQNLHSFKPDVKLIYIVRDPIDRIISHLQHDIYRDRIKSESINKKGFDFSNYINTSKYHWQIEAYLEFWDREDILFLNFDELKDNNQECLKKICQFLGVNEFSGLENYKVTNISSKKYVIKFHDKAHRLLPRRLTKFYHYFWYLINIKKQRPKLTENTLINLKSQLEQDIMKFKTISSLDLSSWKTYNNVN